MPKRPGDPHEASAHGQARALAELVQYIAQHKPAAAHMLPTWGAETRGTADMPPQADALQFFRRTWSRLSAEQRLAQSQSALPSNAGPLNSQHLVHRALTVMRDLSPAYFEHFMAHVDALLWVERAQEHAARQVGLPPRAKGVRKVTGARRG